MVRMKGLEKIRRRFIKDYISLYSPKIRYFKLIITFQNYKSIIKWVTQWATQGGSKDFKKDSNVNQSKRIQKDESSKYLRE